MEYGGESRKKISKGERMEWNGRHGNVQVDLKLVSNVLSLHRRRESFNVVFRINQGSSRSFLRQDCTRPSTIRSMTPESFGSADE
jgi:hypothetical protein